jgi:D-alanyl-D-alanine-carboxypeptidase/D-alanyl-D-alanine-endopeptidase
MHVMPAFRVHTATIATLVATLGLHPLAAQTTFPPDSAIRSVLAERVAGGGPTGIVVGLLDASGARRVIAYGTPGEGVRAPLDGSTVFEIGSITKVFTTAILADMVRKGDVGLDDPVAMYLPADVTVPSREGKPITLGDLATQSSGLPRMPDNFTPADPTNPYADYSVAELYAFLSGYTLPRLPGERYEYSNLGMGLLGHALALKAGVSYETLVAERVLGPLGMHDTHITLTPALRARLATGHDQGGAPAANWDIPTLAGAGALRSTANDMLAFAAANLDTAGPLGAALQTAHEPRVRTDDPALRVGLAWHILKTPATAIVWHNGGTGGYHAFLGLDPAQHTAVVVLSNSTRSIDDIGFHLLDPAVPLQPQPKPRHEIAIDPTLLDGYVGDYELAPTFHLVVTRAGDALFVQATGQPKFPIFPESPVDFFLTVVDAQITFVRDSTGVVTGLVLHQNGRDVPGRRVP